MTWEVRVESSPPGGEAAAVGSAAHRTAAEGLTSQCLPGPEDENQ